MKEIKIIVKDNVDILGLYAVIDGKLYSKYGVCDFEEDSFIPHNSRKRISHALLNGLELTIKSGLRVEKLFYSKIRG